MEYYRTLNFIREPFSNSPDPALFYESKQHLEALQQLEIAIRLKRGLNVIIGDVGTGKTTLCRQLIQQITNDPSIENALILDPAFATTTDFLDCILKFFSGTTYLGCDDTSLKEEIKNYLFLKGVDQKKTIVLLIDEGQKLPTFCLEILRELLNYETNNQKLLQIVIFAQKELDQTIAPLENFIDRINFKYELHPLGFSETKGLIEYRVKESMAEDKQKPIFSFFAYFTLFFFTKGYPRKIINLCHHVLLSLIVQNKTKAGHFFVRTCALKSGNPRKKSIGFLPAALATSIIIISIYFFNFPDISKFWPKQTQAIEPSNISTAFPDISGSTVSTLAEPDTVKPDPAQKISKNSPLFKPDPVERNPVRYNRAKSNQANLTRTKTNQIKPNAVAPQKTIDKEIVFLKKTSPPPYSELKKATKIPDFYGTITVPRNETLSKISEHIYGTFNKKKLALLLNHNKNITNPNILEVGMPIRFPAITNFLNGWNPSHYCIILSENLSFTQAYNSARQLENSAYTVRVFPSQNPYSDELTYHVVINRPYKTLDSATSFKEKYVNIDQATCTRISSITSDIREE